MSTASRFGSSLLSGSSASRPASVKRARARIARAADVQTLRRFRSDLGEAWYARDVQRLVRRGVASCVQRVDDAYEVIVVEVGATVAAVCALATALDGKTCDLAIIAIANDYQGTQVMTDVGAMPLAQVAIDTLLARASELGARRARAIVARANKRSTNMLIRAGFVQSAAFDDDYDVYSVTFG